MITQRGFLILKNNLCDIERQPSTFGLATTATLGAILDIETKNSDSVAKRTSISQRFS
jgi:hypothetical protein